MSTRKRWAAAGFAAVALVAGCGITAPTAAMVDGAPVAEPATVTFPAGKGERSVTVPVMPGWSYTPLTPTNDPAPAQYPSDRFLLANPALREHDYVPTVILTVDKLDGPRQTADDYARELGRKISTISASIAETVGEVCGRPAFLIEFTELGDRGLGHLTQSGVGITVVPDDGRYAYIAILQSRNLDNPGYQSQRDAMLSGFCVG